MFFHLLLSSIGLQWQLTMLGRGAQLCNDWAGQSTQEGQRVKLFLYVTALVSSLNCLCSLTSEACFWSPGVYAGLFRTPVFMQNCSGLVYRVMEYKGSLVFCSHENIRVVLDRRDWRSRQMHFHSTAHYPYSSYKLTVRDFSESPHSYWGTR